MFSASRTATSTARARRTKLSPATCSDRSSAPRSASTDMDIRRKRESVLAALRAFARALSHRFPECLRRQSFSRRDALPRTVEQDLKRHRAAQKDALQVVIILRRQQDGDGLAVARDDDWSFG